MGTPRDIISLSPDKTKWHKCGRCGTPDWSLHRTGNEYLCNPCRWKEEPVVAEVLEDDGA